MTPGQSGGQFASIAVATWISTALFLRIPDGFSTGLLVNGCVAAAAWIGVLAWAKSRWLLAAICFTACVIGPWGYGNILGAPISLGLAVAAGVSMSRQRKSSNLAG
jgi:hypothetical protein